MSTPSLRRLSLFAGLLLPSLLSGCHSARPTFSFRPASEAAPAVTLAPVADSATAPATLVAAPQQQPPIQPRRAAATTAAVARPLRPRLASHRILATPRPATRHHAARRPTEDGRRPHDTFHIVLGAVLIVGSVLVGLWLGGWLGLGVGAAIMLLGDYFLVLGIGGKHAWLEIFQEFFNM